MIKNDTQLAIAEKQVLELRQTVQKMSEQYSGFELELMAGGIEEQIQDIQDDIDEYHELNELSFEEAVSTKLRQPVLIEQIGELLAKLRLAAGLTQTQLAERMNWHQGNLSRFEGENYSAQTLYKIVEYASALGVWLHIFPSLSNEARPARWYETEEHYELDWDFVADTTSDDKSAVDSFVDSVEDISPYGSIDWFARGDEPTSLTKHGLLETAT